MKRIDLRNTKENFLDQLQVQMYNLKNGEVAIFLFEIGDFSGVEQAIDMVCQCGCELMNSLKFNQVDWTIIVKKVKNEI
ncbi:MAG: NADH-ubiquinone oxidoreductase subunit E family protein [Campylobacter sp.]|nr:NADH-ubiquinone oxidoreductase subunit E family protein [Campylobacter sp.]